MYNIYNILYSNTVIYSCTYDRDNVKKWSKNRTFDNFQINILALNVKVSPTPSSERRGCSGSYSSETIREGRRRGR